MSTNKNNPDLELALRYPIVRLGFVLEHPNHTISETQAREFGELLVCEQERYIGYLEELLESAGANEILFDASEKLRNEGRSTVVISFPRANLSFGDFFVDVRVCLTVCSGSRLPKIWCRANLSDDCSDKISADGVAEFYSATSEFCDLILQPMMIFYTRELSKFLKTDVSFSVHGKIRFRSCDVSEAALALEADRVAMSAMPNISEFDPAAARIQFANKFIRERVLSDRELSTDTSPSILELDASGLPWSFFLVGVSKGDVADFVGLCCGQIYPDKSPSWTRAGQRGGEETEYFSSTSHRLTCRLANKYAERF